MEYIEYPKALYRNGEYTIVPDAAHEEVARADGYKDYADDLADAIEDKPVISDEEALKAEREALKAEATELGINFARNASNDKLRELIAEHKDA